MNLRKNVRMTTWGSRYLHLRYIAEALADIHQAGLLHGNLHSGNIIQIGMGYSVISDLGLSVTLRSNSALPNPPRIEYGIIPYVAPEIFFGLPPTTASDVYSLGIIMWELAHNEPVFVDRSHDTLLALQICDGLRPKIDDETPTPYFKLMQACWDPSPCNRPTARVIADTIRQWTEKSELAPLLKFNERPIVNQSSYQRQVQTYVSRRLPNLYGLSETEIRQRIAKFTADKGKTRHPYKPFIY